MCKFLQSERTDDLKSVPGIGEATERALNKLGVYTTYQLYAVYLSFKDKGTNDMKNEFWRYLSDAGIDSHRSSVVQCVTEKMSLLFPEL